VGGLLDGENNRALQWQNGAWFDLNELIPAQSGWVLNDAVDINEQGQVVGNGKLNGVDRAFLLTPVMPNNPT
jgi:hypothetical protein